MDVHTDNNVTSNFFLAQWITKFFKARDSTMAPLARRRPRTQACKLEGGLGKSTALTWHWKAKHAWNDKQFCNFTVKAYKCLKGVGEEKTTHKSQGTKQGTTPAQIQASRRRNERLKAPNRDHKKKCSCTSKIAVFGSP